MTSKYVLISFCLIVSTLAIADSDFQKWKDKNARFLRESAVVQAQGQTRAGTLDAKAGKMREERLKGLYEKQVIAKAEYLVAKRDSTLLQLNLRRSEADLVIAKNERALLDLTKECDAGKETACKQASDAGAAIFKAREAIADVGIARATAEVELSTFYYESYKYLVEKSHLDPAVAEEALNRLNARREELQAAKEQLALVKTIGGESFHYAL